MRNLKQAALISLVTAMLLSSTGGAGDGQRVAPLMDGMTITTSNSVANIEVRAKSMGPGACGVRISTADQVKEFLAPPLIWSPWTVLTSHVGSVTYTISFDHVCDTDAFGEIRYYSN